MHLGKKVLKNDFYDILFLCFPIWLSILFLIGFQLFPKDIPLIFLLALFLLGETHFGATWLFFIDSNNRGYIKQKPIIFFLLPSLVLLTTILVFFYISIEAALVLAAAASAFHVTRQSIGINKIFGERDHKGMKFSQCAIYGMSIFFIGIGFLRFFMNYTFIDEQLQLIKIVSVLLVIGIITFIFSKKENRELSLKYHLTTITGMVIYSPYVFVSRPELAVVLGVGIHWLQYLALTLPLYLRKVKNITKESKNTLLDIAKNPYILTGILLAYAAIMLIARQGNSNFNTFDYSIFIIIPLSLQMLHYYYEAFIWKFSDPHIRKEIGSYLFVQKETD